MEARFFPPVGTEPNSRLRGLGGLSPRAGGTGRLGSQLVAVPSPRHKQMNLVRAQSLGEEHFQRGAPLHTGTPSAVTEQGSQCWCLISFSSATPLFFATYTDYHHLKTPTVRDLNT